MPKSKRLLELMMTVNRKRRFTVKELAEEFQVSTRTILRDLQELSELGVPLYSEVGPHGGYQVLKESILPPIAFTEEEAVALFFASHALRHYTSLPFKEESAAALQKFYHHMSSEVRDRIDQVKNRFDIVTPVRQTESPYLSILLEGAIGQRVMTIEYEAKGERSQRQIQPIGVYAHNGLWYCPAYCFLREGIRVFRCDRMYSADFDTSGLTPMDLREVHLINRKEVLRNETETITFLVELGKEGVQRCEAELWLVPMLHIRENGTGWLEGEVPKRDLAFLADFMISLGDDATVQQPAELVDQMVVKLSRMMSKYQ
ncbi:DNA-binding protein [Bacillus sp. FJAT-27264]|uniref:helix-turn-helix transcriptional regulator n=1 Tax=Paenibacillus sp. (strain DSM 101736 / FJAT-27264) TaxID=1850362 RepID=UPI000807FF4F|nr:YafY family protein [Bacillus sp. FJAT-27264]OBZ10678.1 DNA-binding protein [Bacillus sp. FJAT-27264]